MNFCRMCLSCLGFFLHISILLLFWSSPLTRVKMHRKRLSQWGFTELSLIRDLNIQLEMYCKLWYYWSFSKSLLIIPHDKLKNPVVEHILYILIHSKSPLQVFFSSSISSHSGVSITKHFGRRLLFLNVLLTNPDTHRSVQCNFETLTRKACHRGLMNERTSGLWPPFSLWCMECLVPAKWRERAKLFCIYEASTRLGASGKSPGGLGRDRVKPEVSHYPPL